MALALVAEVAGLVLAVEIVGAAGAGISIILGATVSVLRDGPKPPMPREAAEVKIESTAAPSEIFRFAEGEVVTASREFAAVRATKVWTRVFIERSAVAFVMSLLYIVCYPSCQRAATRFSC